MKTVQGFFENGQITLLEPAPVNVAQKVLVTFIEPTDEERTLSMQSVTQSFEDYLKDDREDLYQEYLK